ncbi:hypothetical protein [Loktanella sp. Alg231-35]|uniref:hypothetical protein n=1 Tax=Loktanella sp. Alg231-35 TaxID=1922220 RepID=UPI00131F1F85|nr:hypothetical protein [Loktanella sp. Alg231-35]
MPEPDPALAAANATMPDALDMHRLALIGVVDAHDGPAALLRSAWGSIARVSVGQEAFGAQITAIGNSQVIVTDRWGRTVALALPGG